MFVIAICTLLVWLFFRFKEKDGLIDGYTSASFVLAPAIIIFLMGLGGRALGLSELTLLPLQIFYFLVPLFILKTAAEYSWKRSFIYAGIVFGIVIIGQMLNFELLSVLSA